MKRFLGLLLALTLLLGTACASVEVTLPEKMLKQIDMGGGVKGTITLSASGSASWLDWLAPLSGTGLQLRYIRAMQADPFQARLYVLDEQENERAVTKLYGDAQDLYLSSELLPETLLTMPLAGASGNPSIYSVLRSFLDIPSAMLEDDTDAKGWPAAIAPYERSLNAWLEAHAATPTVFQGEDGSTRLLTGYELPAQDIKAQMKAMLAILMQDALMQEKLGELMTAEQRALYLNPELMYYYEYIIDALPLEKPILMTRELTAMGAVANSSLTLPLLANEGGWTELVLGQSGDDTSIALKGEKQNLSLVVNRRVANAENTFWTGTLRYLPAEGEKLALAFELRRHHTLTEDAERRSHDKTLWELSATVEQPAGETGYMTLPPVAVTLSTYFHSKHLNQNPTTLELTLNALLPGVALDIAATLKTSSSWNMETLPTNGAQSVTTLTEENVAALLAEYTRNAVQTMTTLTTAELPIPKSESIQSVPEQPDAAQLLPATMTDLPGSEQTADTPDVEE